MTLILEAVAVLAGYALFVLVKPDRHCPSCNGWGQRQKRRRPKACRRCKGTGKAFWPGARLVHRGAALAMKRMRERRERES